MINKNFEKQHNVRLTPKSSSFLMRVLGIFSKSFMRDFWTTYRLPFGRPTITYPSGIKDPLNHMPTIEHELVHVEQIRSTWGFAKSAVLVSVFPLPILFSGRWFLEREAYLHNIKHHGYTVDWVVDTLWNSYGWAWPKPLMRRWFKKQLGGN